MSHDVERINYNRLSRFYDVFTSSEKPFSESGLKMLNVHSGEKVIEIGCGTGKILNAMAKLVGDSGKVYGLDVSEGMLRVAKRRIIRTNLSNRIQLHLGDAINLPFRSGAFDAIFIGFTLELFSTCEILITLSECKRVIRDNGRLVIVAMEKKDFRSVRVYEWFHKRFPSFFDCHPIDAQKMLEMADYKVIESNEMVMWGIPVKMISARKNG
jgi:ubiquinone/menaquinone biosynthesis C-methylase UbiE